jgi:TPR repeat protein
MRPSVGCQRWGLVLLLVPIWQMAYAEFVPAAPRDTVMVQGVRNDAATISLNTTEAMVTTDCEVLSESSGEFGTIAKTAKNRQAARLDAALFAQARGGDASAAWRAALASFRGDCSASNYGQTLGFVQTAAQAGHACATGAWGLMLARGWGTARDLPQARELLEKSAQSGCKRAYYWSWLADEMAARPQTRERALGQLAQGADLGDGHALNALAVVREVNAQRGEARALYVRAASAGNATARTNIARLARYFSQSTEKPSLATLTQNAKAGQAQAQYLLARRFHQGDGVATNYVQALSWYQQAARNGNPAAREMLTLVQARLDNASSPAAVLVGLSMVDINSDELNKKRGVMQPIEDTDPFAGL